ncbi:MAG: chemotaxis protein CheC [Chloroflexi bacterium]|nr:chemotaxis protein CheC [Chloroflexota bacterium]
MQLTATQQDALVELINVAFGRAAAALSGLTGQRVLLEVPEVAVCPLSDLGQVLGKVVQGEIATVHQIFGGEMTGDALLLLDYTGAVLLSELLVEHRPKAKRLDVSDREVLTEVGNILLNACLGTFGNMLHVHISFAVPRLRLEDLDGLLHSLVIGRDELRYALVIYTTFRLRESGVGGYLVIVLGVASLDRLVQEVEHLG